MVIIEIWKDIDGYEGIYQVSNIGRVKSLDRIKPHNTAKCGYIEIKGKMLKPMETYKGYLCVDLRDGFKNVRKTIPIHRLVAFAFINNPKPEEYNQVNHIDGNKKNNKIENLEWCNNSMNQLHAYKNGLNHHGEAAGRPKKPVIKISLDGNIIQKYNSVKEAATDNNIKTASNIGMVCNGYRNTAGGFTWKFV